MAFGKPMPAGWGPRARKAGDVRKAADRPSGREKSMKLLVRGFVRGEVQLELRALQLPAPGIRTALRAFIATRVIQAGDA